MFVFDIETLDIDSSAVILSAAIVYMGDLERDTTEDLSDVYSSLLEKTLYVKFKVSEQIDEGRTASKATLDWWKEQNSEIRALAFNPSRQDVCVEDGVGIIKKYMKDHGMDKDTIVWARGSLDQMAIDSLCRWFNIEPIAHYAQWRDVRTAIDCLATKPHRGYSDLIKPFNNKLIVKKHDPRHDVCYDALMLEYYA
jgi:hypothetical protein